MGGRTQPRVDRGFERMYRRHVTDVYRYAAAVLSNPADAEDVAQTVFMNAYRAYQAGERPEQPLNWLITIAHNVCRQRFRDVARRPREVTLEAELAADPVDEQEPKYRSEDITRALGQLSLNQRAALALRELEGRSYGEIASILGLSTSAVETLLFRARRAFREQLEGSLTCSEAEHAISRQLDGVFGRSERGDLRAHLRSCPECASLARRFRAQRSALQGIAVLPLPPSLSGSFGAGTGVGGGAALGAAVGLKAAALGTAAVVAVGAGTTELVRHTRAKHGPAVSQVRKTTTTAPKNELADAAPASLPPASASAVVSAPDRIDTRATRTAAQPARPARHPRTSTTSPSSSVPAASPTPSADPAPASAQTADVRTETAARPQPQQSGGGTTDSAQQDMNVKQDDRSSQPGRSGGQGEDHGQGNGQQSKPDHPDHPDHPPQPDHPAQPDHPEHPNGGGPPGDEQPAPPEDHGEPPLPSVTVPGPDLPDPPVDLPGPPGKSDPPGKHDPPGKKHGLIPSLFG